MSRWTELSERQLKLVPTPIVDFYDQICEVFDIRASTLKIRRPIDLIKKGHARLYAQEADGGMRYRAELTEPLLELILEMGGKPKFVRGASEVSKTTGEKVVWVGADPRGRYPDCKNWYGRRVGKKLRGRTMLELPMVAATATAGDDTGGLNDVAYKKLRRRAFRF